MAYIESFDEGSESFLNIYEFSPIDPDEQFGRTSTFSSFDEALKYAGHTYNASDIKYVSGGMIQEEYKLYKKL
ncbi:hypothetical protein [Sphingobacterium faecale]|uniref:Uncharacterized protein n=1 Tax=Sphingobacterium faecale TaxID=2803775 RepID=A0ABS1R8S0_9SPHI|nr:hypothetical protein [Sphingobacterium faecale]MBL1411073.1 hypothetical protein [Sphingobacterium faecale]